MTILAQPRHDLAGRRKHDAVASMGDRWDQYRLTLDIADLVALRDHLAKLSIATHDHLYEVLVALDEEVRTIPAETVVAIRGQQEVA